jgi:hypothetical protein
MKIDTQFLFRGVIVSFKFLFDGIQKIAPERSFKAGNDDAVFDVLRSRGTERRLGEDDEVVAVKKGEVNGGHGETIALGAEVSDVALDSPLEIGVMLM